MDGSATQAVDTCQPSSATGGETYTAGYIQLADPVYYGASLVYQGLSVWQPGYPTPSNPTYTDALTDDGWNGASGRYRL